jgi:hypothetical protein
VNFTYKDLQCFSNSEKMEIEKWIKTVVGVIIGLYIVASLITTLAPTNALFSTIIFSCGILAAVIIGAQKLLK